MKPADVTAICDAALAAWHKAPDDARKAEFVWRGQTYVASRTGFRLQVKTLDGKPVAQRWD